MPAIKQNRDQHQWYCFNIIKVYFVCKLQIADLSVAIQSPRILSSLLLEDQDFPVEKLLLRRITSVDMHWPITHVPPDMEQAAAKVDYTSTIAMTLASGTSGRPMTVVSRLPRSRTRFNETLSPTSTPLSLSEYTRSSGVTLN